MRRSFFALEGQARLWIVLDYLPVDQVRAMLPSFATLGDAPPRTPEGMHPVFYSFGVQTVRLHGLRWFSRTYRESIVGICFVRLNRGSASRQPYSVMTAAAADSLLAVVLGRLLGYPKVFKRIDATERAFDIRRLWSGEAVMCGSFESNGLRSAPSDPAAAQLSEILSHPVLSRAAWGTLLSSSFQNAAGQFHFTPVAAAARVPGSEMTGLPPGCHQWDGLGAVTAGAALSAHEWFSDPPVRAH
jgi:hypothetical protein